MKKTVKQIIENILAFRSGLSEYFLALKEKAKDKRAEMLLDYLGRHEDYISKHLTKYIRDSEDKALNLWINIVPWLPNDIFSSCVKDMNISTSVSVDDIIDIAIHYYNCLIDCFTVLVNESEYTTAELIFSNFLKQAKSEERKFVRDSLWLHDM